MADLDFSRETTDNRLLLISFDNERPISAREAASLFRALDLDYRDMTGSSLVIARLETGSLWVWLSDAAMYASSAAVTLSETVAAIEHLTAFTKNLITALKPSVTISQHQPKSTHSVHRSVAAVSKLVEKKDCNVRLRHSASPDGNETFELEISAAQAVAARDRHTGGASAEAEKIFGERRVLTTELMELKRFLPKDDGDFDSILRIIINLLKRTGSIYILEEFANQLEAEGHWSKAQIVRRHLKGGDGPFDR